MAVVVGDYFCGTSTEATVQMGTAFNAALDTVLCHNAHCDWNFREKQFNENSSF